MDLMETMPDRWEFTVFEDGNPVAFGDCSTRELALAEGMHYLAHYQRDGGKCWLTIKPPACLDDVAGRE